MLISKSPTTKPYINDKGQHLHNAWPSESYHSKYILDR